MKNLVPTLLLSALLATQFTGCASTPNSQSQLFTPSATTSSSPVTNKLVEHYTEWKGTPYKMGGQSKWGIDCSAFVQLTYNKVFGKTVPRTTEQLSQSGKKITLAEAQVGDLILFKTGTKQRHAGIYIGDGKFIHASTSKGVVTSKMETPYWRDNYWQTRRVVDL